MGQTIDRQFQALAGGAQVNIFTKKIYLSNDLVNIWLKFDFLRNDYLNFKGLLSTAISIGPPLSIVLPAASLTLDGTNFFNNINQQNVLHEQQSSVDAISSRVAAVETAVASSTSAASSGNNE